ncbi:MAG: DUF4079 family protein [Myxococcota bacterium]
MDPDGRDALLRGLAWLHPTWMAAALAIAFAALRSGLELRRRRARRGEGLAALRRSHLLRAKLALPLLVAGFALGPVAAVLARDMTPFRTLHAWVGVATLALFVAAGVTGHRLEEGALPLRAPHARLALAALLASAVAFATGFVLLP